MQDLYPSRKSQEVSIIPRKDPIIHAGEGQENHSPLSQEQINSYEKNGFLMLENFFSETEVKEMSKEIYGLADEYKQSDKPEVVREPTSEEIRSIFAVHQNSDYFDKVSADQRLLDIVNYLLGGDVYVNQSRINYKPGFTGKEFYWHSDFETWHVEDGMPRMRAVSVSIALSDNYSFNGPLMLIPGSHEHFISCIGEAPEDHYKKSLKMQEFGVPDHDSMRWLADEYGISVPTGPAGSVLLFECNTMHGSNSNITPFGRNNLFMVYNSVENRLVEPFSGAAPRPEFIAARKKLPVLG
ncbi:ectoine hydroxylase [Sediminibacillus halophilus]|uniref:Ectoine hydroxylase n=1 Tax=Sediminibacillus halophilus TaxID=482461 RepID=A0A1G9VAJ6_9BACI|nr:ectoine hydroxylase [Sediminibacillus halophilus]SDM69248.1 ectoine hydroxylase [Sediminibacillus halophilus]